MIKKVAIMYDFDSTLCTKNMQEYSLFPKLGIDPGKFWDEVNAISKKYEMDSTLAYMYLILEKAKDVNIPITEKFLKELGKDVVYYKGVESYFDRINKYALKHNIVLEHYVISSGTYEMLEGCSIFDKFIKVFGCKYHYNKLGVADWPSVCINYTVKTQFLYRINKNALDVSDNTLINSKINDKLRKIGFNNMIYIGDGLTDVPCMTIVKNSGGHSIAVYTPEKEDLAKQLVFDGRVNYIAKADYSKGSDLDCLIKDIIDLISATNKLNNRK